MWFGVSPRTDIKIYEFKKDLELAWNMWEDLCAHSMNMIVFTLKMNKIFIRALKL